jgi:hypothetical protein
MKIVLSAVAIASPLVVSLANVPANDLNGTVKDVCGVLLPGTSVSVANASGTRAHVRAEGDGQYVLRNLTAGQWTVTFELLGFLPLKQDILLPQNGDNLQLNVRLLPDLLMKQELIKTHSPSNVHYRRYSVHGVVLARGGEPVAAATVRLHDVLSKKSVGADPCTTDESGRYAITEWSPTETKWQISVRAEGFRPYTHSEFTLQPDEPRAIDLLLQE